MSSVPSDRFKKYLSYSNAPAIVRSNQKDSYFENLLNNQLTEVVKIFKNSRFIHKYPEELKSISTLLYLSLTTLLGSKTLGEEYVDLIYVTRDGKRIPRFLPRLGFIASYVVVPYILRRLLKRLSSEAEDEENARNNEKTKQPVPLKHKLKKALSNLTYFNIVDLMNMHLALFYFTGKYYQFSKRVFGLRYALGYQLDTQRKQSKGNYELLGLLIVVQTTFKNYNNLKNLLISDTPSTPANSSNGEDDDTNNDLLYAIPELVEDAPVNSTDILLSDPTQLPYIPENARSCMLCLSYMTNPTCGLCGHIFCWSCIIDWCKERQECPLCRAKIKEANLLPLR